MVRWSSVVSSTNGFPIHLWFSAFSTRQNTAWYPETTPIRSLQSNFQDTFMDRFLTTSTLTVFNLPILRSRRMVQVAQTMPEEEVWVLADTANWYTLLSGKLTFRESLVLGTTSQANWPSHWNTKENQMNTSIDYLHDVHSQCIENQFITLILHFSNCMYNLVNKKKIVKKKFTKSLRIFLHSVQCYK